MRLPMTTISAAVLFSAIGLGSAEAIPVFGAQALAVPSAAAPVRWVCDQNRCIDTSTGAYTQSTCRRGRCTRLGGIVGYTDPRQLGYPLTRNYRDYDNYGYQRDPRYGYGRDDGWDDDRRYRRRYGDYGRDYGYRRGYRDWGDSDWDDY